MFHKNYLTIFFPYICLLFL